MKLKQKNTTDVKVIQEIEKSLNNYLKENNIEQARSSLKQLARIVGCYPCPVDLVFQTNIPKILINMLKKSCPITDQKCKVWASFTLANITTGTKEQLNELFKLDFIPIILYIISVKDIELADNVILAFSNILIDHHQPHHLIRIFQDCPQIIEQLCYYFSVDQINTNIHYQLNSLILRCLSDLTKIIRVSQDYYNQLRVCFPYLTKLLDLNHPRSISFQNKNFFLKEEQQANFNKKQQSNRNGDNKNKQKINDIQQNKFILVSQSGLIACVLTIKHLSNSNTSVIRDLIHCQIHKVLLKYLEIGIEISDSILLNIIQIFADMSNGNDFQTYQLLKLDIYSYLIRFINHSLESIRKNICWLISNLVASDSQSIEIFIKNQMVEILTYHLNVEQSLIVKQEIIYALCNATSSATKEQIKSMVLKGLLRTISEYLIPQFSDELLNEMLEAIENIMESGIQDNMNSNVYMNEFKRCGCQKEIEDLYYYHKNNIITNICHRIMNLIS